MRNFRLSFHKNSSRKSKGKEDYDANVRVVEDDEEDDQIFEEAKDEERKEHEDIENHFEIVNDKCNIIYK